MKSSDNRGTPLSPSSRYTNEMNTDKKYNPVSTPVTPSPTKQMSQGGNKRSLTSSLTCENSYMRRIVSRTTKLMEVVNCAYAMRQIEDEWLREAGDKHFGQAEQVWLEQQRQRMLKEQGDPVPHRTSESNFHQPTFSDSRGTNNIDLQVYKTFISDEDYDEDEFMRRQPFMSPATINHKSLNH